MFHYSAESLPAFEEPRTKRQRVESTTLEPNTARAGASNLGGRARINNAAETPYFYNRRALVYHFLDVYNAEVDSNGTLKSCVLRCGLCGRGSWQWRKNGRTKGSTSNMNNHMKEKHYDIWQAGVQSDKTALGVTAVARSNDHTPVKSPPSMSSSEPFNIEVFNKKLTRWFVKKNIPIAEMENEAFRDLLLFLRPPLEGQLLNSAGIREHIEAMRQAGE